MAIDVEECLSAVAVIDDVTGTVVVFVVAGAVVVVVVVVVVAVVVVTIAVVVVSFLHLPHKTYISDMNVTWGGMQADRGR